MSLGGWRAGKPRRNMAKSMAGFLEKPAILFAMFFDLGLIIAPNSLFWSWDGRQRLYLCSKAQS